MTWIRVRKNYAAQMKDLSEELSLFIIITLIVKQDIKLGAIIPENFEQIKRLLVKKKHNTSASRCILIKFDKLC